MNETDLCFTPATELVDALRARKLSAVEITATVLKRITALEPKLNAFAYLAAEEAMDAAQAADRALAKGDPIGPLHGVPVTIKDHEAVRGMQLEYGTHLRRGDVAQADNAMVARLRQAGAIILGKTATPEFGWMGVSNSPLTGITHNPWKHGMNAGASSAGAGVGAAAGYGPLHQGSDGAGSIRMPAHFSGVYGLKPTYGRVPQSPLAASDYTVASRAADAHGRRCGADAEDHGGTASRTITPASRRSPPTIRAISAIARARRASPTARISIMPGSIRKWPNWSPGRSRPSKAIWAGRSSR